MINDRYHKRLHSIPAPGHGCHVSLLGVANLGVMAGLNHAEIFDGIRKNIRPGNRKVSNREIEEAIQKAVLDHGGGIYTPRPRPQPVTKNGKSVFQKIIAQGKIQDEVDLWESSPLRLWDKPEADPVLLLSTLYKPTDLVFIGERIQKGIVGQTIRTAWKWIEYFQNGGKTSAYIIPNPLTGKPTTKKSGDEETLRGDGNIAEYRFCVVEFDNLPRGDQIRFWSAIKLPVVVLLDSGGKSIHAWLDVSKIAKVTSPVQWEAEVKSRLYDRILTPLGVDGACSNEARLSRLPGHYRTEKSAFQRILWVSPEGKLIC